MKKFISSHIPHNREKGKKYFKTFFPIIMGSLLFAMNSFVDNFMVGGVDQGVASLSAANSGTNIFMGFLSGTAASGSVIFAQFYFGKKTKEAKEISHFRFFLSIVLALIFAILAGTIPDKLNGIFLTPKSDSKVDINKGNIEMNGARDYIRPIAFSGILMAFTFNFGNQFREIGYGRVPMYGGIATLLTNITFNSIFILGLKGGVEGAAYASIIARVGPLMIGFGGSGKEDLPTKFVFFEIFNFNIETIKVFFKRGFQFLSTSTIIAFITLRNHFYDDGYPVNSLGHGVGGMLVLGLTGAIMNVFTTTFNSLSAMSANFVASEMGKGNIGQAKRNANELKGFNAIVSGGFSLLMALFATFVPYMSFLSYSDGVDTHEHLKQVQYSLYVVSIMYPIGIGFVTSFRNGLTGGKGLSFAVANGIVTGLQLGGLAIVMLYFVTTNQFLQENFWAGYAIFFVSDFVKLITMESIYYRYKWVGIISTEQAKIEEEVSHDAEEIIPEDIT